MPRIKQYASSLVEVLLALTLFSFVSLSLVQYFHGIQARIVRIEKSLQLFLADHHG